jgi:adenylosuccinate synthase
MVNGFDNLAVTNLDGLDGIETIRLCTHYELDGEVIDLPPARLDDLARCKPRFIEMPGWLTDTTAARSMDDLPLAARNYLREVCKVADGAELALVGVGPERDQTIMAQTVSS